MHSKTKLYSNRKRDFFKKKLTIGKEKMGRRIKKEINFG